MKQDPENFNLLYSRLILDQLFKYGIKNFIISPGLRNAPLMIALKKLDDIHVSVSIDERAAGYMALGQYKATGVPSVLICTSGTAMANYYPAIIEAQKTNTSIIIISADRPKELHNESSNQTMDQINIFKTLTKSTLNLPIQDQGISLQSSYTQVERYIRKALAEEVIHLNFPFREPLDTTQVFISKQLIQEFHVLINSSPSRLITKDNSVVKLDKNLYKDKNGLLVIGELNSHLTNAELEEFRLFIKSCPWPKILDITTSLKYGFSLEDNNFPSFDHPEVYNAFQDNCPDLVVHLGGKLTSKKYHEFIYNCQAQIINISQDKNSEKALSRVNQYISMKPHEFAYHCLKQEIIFSLRDENYLPAIKALIEPIITTKVTLIDDAPLTFPKISKHIVEVIAENSDLYLANSTTIRSFDSYSSFEKKKQIRIMTHRGVSGIEGFLAASLAFHKAKEKKMPTVLVLGDVSFLHDLNSLNLIKESNISQNSFVIILINNFGGGIFTLVPFKDDHNIMPWMTTPHEYQFDKICETFGIRHDFVFDFETFENLFTKALKRSGPQILELKVDNKSDLDIYQKLKTVRL
ncbi:MAG: 2-succinyl-5-enolpyruvyl-6-hydroxy-3-cyclohexene-1-carboxylic-acid synthase [Bacteriovoracaceae bacterium]|nr:2-succinyl-5-enolpyruvyl-6-hydroxy-3-cyclohexene-1-carboxylic-acid synthase [Bacteriovoracaceae bacterium]